MKAIIVEFLNTNNAWVWYKVYRSKSPTQAIGDYLKDHYEAKDIKGWAKKIEKIKGEYYYGNEIRAYKINIE